MRRQCFTHFLKIVQFEMTSRELLHLKKEVFFSSRFLRVTILDKAGRQLWSLTYIQ